MAAHVLVLSVAYWPVSPCQSLIQKRSDVFTQGLMDKLLKERNTLNDLSMLDPLTGLYNRRGLQKPAGHHSFSRRRRALRSATGH